MHQDTYTCPPDLPCLLHPISIVLWKHGYTCVTLCVFQSPHFCSHTLFKIRACISTCTHVHLTPNVRFHSLSIVTWKHGCPCVAMCPAVTPLQLPHLYLECIHASVHVFMSIWLLSITSNPMHCYMEIWVPLCCTACVCPSHPACGTTPWLKPVHVLVPVYMSTWINMWLPMSDFTPLT